MSERPYWMSLREREGDPALLEEARREFPEELPVGDGATSAPSRRSFFKIMGLSSAAAVAACQRAPVEKVIPYVSKPEEVTPGLATWYASTCGACASPGCGLLVKTRDGRPIKVEGNELHPLSEGGLCAAAQASVLGLYDSARARGPHLGGKPARWDEIDLRVTGGLEQAVREGKAIRVVAPPLLGPTAEAALARLLAAYPTARRVGHDPLGVEEAIARAHALTHGVRAVPLYRFDLTKVIVSIGADFLGAWVTPVANAKQYARGRDLATRGWMSRHYQLEPTMSLTGSNADVRWTLAPSDVLPVLAALAAKLGVGAPPAGKPALAEGRIAELAAAIGGAKGEALVVCGSPDPAVQALCNAINEAAGAYGATLSLVDAVPRPETLPMAELLGELQGGKVGVVIFHGTNPVYTHPEGGALAKALAGVLAVSTADRLDETATACQVLAPDHHALESWGDWTPRQGLLSLQQPALAPLFDTRAAVESFAAWARAPRPAYDQLRERWEREVFPKVPGAPGSFQAFFDGAVHDGVATVLPDAREAPYRKEGLGEAFAGRAPDKSAGSLELAVFATAALRDGRLANNGWLQELPDPIGKTTWGNVAMIAPSTAARLGVGDGDLVAVEAGGRRIELPVLAQPGTHPNVVGVALGYGRTRAGRIGDNVGANAFPLAGAARAEVRPTGGKWPLAQSQTHHSLEGRPHIQELALADALAGKVPHDGKVHLSMWSGHVYAGHRWGMAIDLSACTGCSACVVSCQAENNIPIVGVEEVRMRREMHWLRIDRYYAGEVDEPRVLYQPMMCQHCENAPCESVCPVLATVHSDEGLNQQVYNRCVGTRYCANNCPTKVRRFNWFDYEPSAGARQRGKVDTKLERMVLNPDVVVRNRGVMEKCSLCVQRIQEGKAQAKAEGRPFRDGEIRTACQQSCPSNAIVFGDLNDPSSRVSRMVKSGATYRVLEELNINASIHYTAKVRNGHGPFQKG